MLMRSGMWHEYEVVLKCDRAKHNDEVVWKDIHAFLDEIKNNQGVKKIAAIGYWYDCHILGSILNHSSWGGRYTIKLGATDLVDAIATAHASKVDIPTDIENIKKVGILSTPNLTLYYSRHYFCCQRQINYLLQR